MMYRWKCWKRTANAICIITIGMWRISLSCFMARGAGRKLDDENSEKRLMRVVGRKFKPLNHTSLAQAMKFRLSQSQLP